MVLLDMKNDKTLSLPLNSSSSKDKPLVSFADLLKGVSEKKESKSIQNGSSVLALGVEEKSTKSIKSSSKTENQESLTKIQSSKSSPKDNLASLLSGDKLSQEEKSEILELDPKFIQNQTLSEMRTLISNAKNYLKDVIQNSDDYKKSEIKELPKTLGGLIEAAKKFGIDVNKITIEEVKKVVLATVLIPDNSKKALTNRNMMRDMSSYQRQLISYPLKLSKAFMVKFELFKKKCDEQLDFNFSKTTFYNIILLDYYLHNKADIAKWQMEHWTQDYYKKRNVENSKLEDVMKQLNILI